MLIFLWVLLVLFEKKREGNIFAFVFTLILTIYNGNSCKREPREQASEYFFYSRPSYLIAVKTLLANLLIKLVHPVSHEVLSNGSKWTHFVHPDPHEVEFMNSVFDSRQREFLPGESNWINIAKSTKSFSSPVHLLSLLVPLLSFITFKQHPATQACDIAETFTSRCEFPLLALNT